MTLTNLRYLFDKRVYKW